MDKLSIEDVFGKDGVFDKEIPNYQVREGQIKMAHGVLDSFNKANLFIVEAGTGTGKTYSYLIPAILSNKNILISTASKALQDQIIQNDVPKLLQILKADNIKYMVLKGVANYLCLKKYKDSMDLSPKQKETLDRLIEREYKLIKDDSNQANFMDANIFKGKVHGDLTISDSRECINCPYISYKEEDCKCFSRLARMRAARCQLVIINHALFFTDAASKNKNQNKNNKNQGSSNKLLPSFNAYVFDEAHSLPEVARNFLTETMSAKELSYEMDILYKEFIKAYDLQTVLQVSLDKNLKNSLHEKINKLNVALGEYQDYLSNLDFIKKNNNRVNFLDLKYENNSEKGQVKKVNQDIAERTNALYIAMKEIYRFFDDIKENFAALAKETMSYLDYMSSILINVARVDVNNENDPDNKKVATVELHEKDFALSLTPIDVGSLIGSLFNNYTQNNNGVVCTSATIAVNGDFQKYENDIGANFIPDFKYNNLILPSIFDYKNNSRLYISKDFPPVQDSKRVIAIIDMLKDVIDAVQGGIFFLTTSNLALELAYDELKRIYQGKREVLAQNKGQSNLSLIEDFKKDGRAILIGTASFWEGVDVPGSALSLVIIDKIPFTAPSDPLFQARSELCESKGISSFFNISVPEAIIDLRQGVGRLIRKESDRGAMIVCDPRLEDKPYGKRFIQALPPMTKCKSLSEIIDFLKE